MPPLMLVVLGELNECLTRAPTKVLAIDTSNRLDALAPELRAQLAGRVEVAGLLPHHVEVVADGVSKRIGLRFVCRRLRIGREHVIAFGDGANDIPLLHEAVRTGRLPSCT